MSLSSDLWKLREKRLLEEKLKEQKSEEIAPVKTVTEEKAQDDSWFKSSEIWDDGYQFGDVFKTAYQSVRDVSTNILGGILDIGEAVVDRGAYLGGLFSYYNPFNRMLNPDIAEENKKKTEEFIKSDLYDGTEVIKSISNEDLVKQIIGVGTEEGSVFGEKSDSFAQSGGQLAAQLAANAVLPGSGMVLMATTAFGSEVENALNQGATFEEAGLSAAISAGAEVLTEKIGGISFGGKTLTDAAFSKLSKNMTNKVAKVLITSGKVTADALAEGGEEILSGYMGAIGQKLTYMEDKEIEELFSNEDLLESFIGGTVLGGLGGGGSAVMSISKGVDPVSGLTKNERKVVEKVYKDALAEADGKVSKSKLWDEIVEKMNRGEISTDTIEEVLGDKTYKDYKTTIEAEESVMKELEELYEGDELQQQIDDILNNSNRFQIKNQLSNEVSELVKGDRLIESYNERANRSQQFKADVTKYDPKHRDTIQKAIDSGILNNTRKTHEFVDIIAKISADKGVSFDFLNNQKLKESGFAVDGKQVNGLVTESGISINIDSPKAWQSTVGHEITHVLEGTDMYDALQQTLFDYAKSRKGTDSKFDSEYKERLYNTRQLYKDVKGYEGVDGFTKIKNEVTADLVGDYLFTDEKFIKHLSAKNRNVFEKIYDEIKYLCKVATAGSKEARELEKVKKAFEDAYRAEGKANGDTQYSLSDSDGKQLSNEQQEYFKDSKMRDENGNLKVMYHGTPNGDYTIFKDGTYFTDNKEYADRYQNPGASSISSGKVASNPKTFEVYLDIKKPFDINDAEARRIYIEDYIKGGNAMGINPYLSDAEYAEIKTIDWTEGEDLREFLIDNGYDYDGLVLDEGADGGYGDEVKSRGTSYVVFSPEQVKNVDNKAPTSDPDIRFSLSVDSEGRELSHAVKNRFANTKVVDENGSLKVVYHGTASGEFSIFDKSKGSVEGDFGSGFYFTDSEADVSEHYEDGGPDFDNKVARLAERIEQEEDIDYAEAKARAREELYKGGHKFEVYLNVENPAIVGETILLDPESYYEEYDRDDYDSEEDYEGDVEQLIADEIDNLVWEVEKNVDVYNTDGLAGVLWEAVNDGGIDIEQLKANINNLYLEDSEGNLVGNEVTRQIIESLGYDGIIDPTVSTKWNMDMESGTTHYIVFKPNQIKDVANKSPTDNPDIHRSLSNKGEQAKYGKYSTPANELRYEVPVQNIAPVVETVQNIAPEVKTSKGGEVKGHHKEAVRNESPKTAQILTEEPKVQKKNNWWSRVKNTVLDKGMVFEELSQETGNRELQARWNTIRYAEGKAQKLIGEGNASTRSLKSIQEAVEKSGKTKQFYEYLYHMHNADRMTLEERFKNTQNKAVFGDKVTAEISRDAAAKLAKANPEFKQWAKDIYNYNKYLRELLVDGGVISSETAKLWEEMYPHYVPIRRVGDAGMNINVPLDTGRTGVNAPIKKATGGNQDILPLFDTMAQRTIQTYKAIAKNRFGVELKNTLGTATVNEATSVDEAIDSIDTQDGLLQEGKNGQKPTFTVFENGEKVTFEITEEMYDAMKPTSDLLSGTSKTLNTISNIRRGTLTEYNPWFLLKNAVKDVQDVLINSQHAARTYATMPEAIKQMATKGHWYQEYMSNGGDQNTYFDKQTNTFAKENKALEIAKTVTGLNAIAKANNIVEMLPRLSEYIASRKAKRSVDVAMLDAARVTTNFAAGGDLTKFANRNGFTFLNASVQGAVQQARNIYEAKQNGLKGWVNLAAKFTLAGLPAVVLNHLIWGDDEEYEELSDYVKDSYYIVGKYGDGQFVRIPKGRTVAVLQSAFEQMGNLVTGNDEVDLGRFLELAVSNLAPNNPLDNNVLSPIVQVASNKTWYGEDLVPTRLQDLPAAEQYDESTDAISRWLGETFNISPYKANYLLDQYSGVIGDTFLPMLTPEAESGDNSFLGNMIAPLKDMFTTDSVMNNQNVSDFYNKVDELTVNANSSKATDEDVLKYKYINSINADLSELYQQKREIQNSDLADDEKYAQVREIQQQIDNLTREGLNSYEDVSVEENYATVADRHYRWYEPSKDSEAEAGWQKITEKQLAKQEKVTSGLNITPNEYWGNKEEYDYAYDYPEKYAVAKSVGGYENFKTYSNKLNDIKSDKDGDGKSISGSRKEKVIDYVNGLDIDYGQKIILFKSEYKSDNTYNYDIVDYLNSRNDISYDEMVAILKELGFQVSSDGYVTWD